MEFRVADLTNHMKCASQSCCQNLFATHQKKNVMVQADALARLDSRLDELMVVVRLSYLISREGGWGAVTEWGETLSLGADTLLCIGLLSPTFTKHGVASELLGSRSHALSNV